MPAVSGTQGKEGRRQNCPPGDNNVRQTVLQTDVLWSASEVIHNSGNLGNKRPPASVLILSYGV